MCKVNNVKDNGSMPTAVVAVAPKEQPTMRRYIVPVVAKVPLVLVGKTQVYSISEQDAIAKVHHKLENNLLDSLELQDDESGAKTTVADATWCENAVIEIDTLNVERDHLDEVTEEDVLRSQVEEIESEIAWNTDTLEQHKAFLETLIA